MWHQETDYEDENERRCPRRYPEIEDGEVGVDFVCFHRFVGEEEEDPDACADGGAVKTEDEAFEEGVEAAREQSEGSGEEEEGHNGAVLGFEALEERDEGESVEEVVEDVAVEERVGVEAVDFAM